METISPTERRRQQAAAFAAQLGLDPRALFAGAMAAWSNLNPKSVTFDRALSVAAAVLAADSHERRVPEPGAGHAAWRRCRHCRVDIIPQGPRPDWAARTPTRHPTLFCPEAPGGDSASSVQLHEPEDGDGRRSFQLAADPIRYGHGKQLMREVIETGPDGRRSVIAVIPDAHSFDTWELLGRVYQLGREDRAADSEAEVLAQARATRGHMRAWAAGGETHRGEEEEKP